VTAIVGLGMLLLSNSPGIDHLEGIFRNRKRFPKLVKLARLDAIPAYGHGSIPNNMPSHSVLFR